MATNKAAKIPSLLYGTAWKKEQTQELVRQALISGFRGVDTAAQVSMLYPFPSPKLLYQIYFHPHILLQNDQSRIKAKCI